MSTMPVAEIIAIGTELLLGQIQDTNTSYVAHALNEAGIDIYRATIIGDNEKRIAALIRETLERADIIITTGGLGPTVDDPTRNAVALAFNIKNEFHPELWEEIKEHYCCYGRIPSDNNKRQAYLPTGAVVIHNPVGTAPAFYIESNEKIVFSLPGVPSEMKTLLHNEVIPTIIKKYHPQSVIVTRVVHTIGIGESSVDELVDDLETLPNPTIGLAAHPGQVDIRITAKATNTEEANSLIKPVEEEVRRRLGDFIYGDDQTTILDVVNHLLNETGIQPMFFCPSALRALVEPCAAQLNPTAKLIEISQDYANALSVFEKQCNPSELCLFFEDQHESAQGIDLQGRFMNNTHKKALRFGGHPSLYPQWMSNQILNFIREIIVKEKGMK